MIHLARRHSIYKLSKDLPVAADEVMKVVERATELVPDAFNMKSQRVAIVMGAQNDQLWDTIYDAFGGKASRRHY